MYYYYYYSTKYTEWNYVQSTSLGSIQLGNQGNSSMPRLLSTY